MKLGPEMPNMTYSREGNKHIFSHINDGGLKGRPTVNHSIWTDTGDEKVDHDGLYSNFVSARAAAGLRVTASMRGESHRKLLLTTAIPPLTQTLIESMITDFGAECYMQGVLPVSTSAELTAQYTTEIELLQREAAGEANLPLPPFFARFGLASKFEDWDRAAKAALDTRDRTDRADDMMRTADMRTVIDDDSLAALLGDDTAADRAINEAANDIREAQDAGVMAEQPGYDGNGSPVGDFPTTDDDSDKAA